jgi:hypothetical protein
MILTISYAGSDTNDIYWHLQNRLVKNCHMFQLEHHAYSLQWLRTTQYYNNHRDVLDIPRGNGAWAWKPYIIEDALADLQENDIVCYMDASTAIKVDPTEVINSVKDVLVCDSTWVNHDWIKRDCFILMDCDKEMYWNATQVWAGGVVIRNTKIGNKFVADWKRYCCDRCIISDDASVLGANLPGFRDHRHDQAILTLLITKYMLEYKMPGVETRPTLPFVDDG